MEERLIGESLLRTDVMFAKDELRRRKNNFNTHTYQMAYI